MKRFLACVLMMMLLMPTALGETIAQGDSGDTVRALQERLIELELLTDKADGIYGKQTIAAISEAQRLLLAAGYDVPQDGSADVRTQALLIDPEAESALRTLRRGSKSERVKALQNRLIDLGLLNGAADGAYGANTQSAVEAFQQLLLDFSLSEATPTGVADPATLALLSTDLSLYGYQAPIYFDETQPLTLTDAHIYSSAAILMDAPSGEVLFAHRADEPRYPASTTKMMTLLLALENSDLSQLVVIPESAADIPADSSLVPITVGEELRMQDLLYGLMMRSGNDAANAVAELCAGSVEAFVEQMNEKAALLGMANTHFMNPHGYHDEAHHTTARDLAILARAGLSDASFIQVVTCLRYVMPATNLRGELVISNPYEIFDPESPYYIEGAAGIKSGYTSHAGFCYVGAFQRDGRTLIAVILGSPTRNRAWDDLRRLFAYGLAS